MFKEQGQSLVEIVVALFIISVIISSFGGLALGGNYLLLRSSQTIQARALASEGIDAVRSIRNRDWNEFIYEQSALAVVGGEWHLAGEGTTEQIGRFTRLIELSPVYRNGSFDIVAPNYSGASLDENSREVRVGVSWEIRPGTLRSVTSQTYLTNFN